MSRHDDLPKGALSGRLFIMWVGEGGSAGSGKFVYVPDKTSPLTFRWPKEEAEGKSWVVQPRMMYTDGGSIPRIAQVFKGMDPWSYGPAYVIHDWIYNARYCNRDGVASGADASLEAMDFETSGKILRAAINALMETGRVKQADVAPDLITAAVSSPIARRLWNQDGACRDREVTPEHRREAEAALFDQAAPMARRKSRPAARIIASYDF